MRADVLRLLLLSACMSLSACGSLLPSERAESQSPFIDYRDAEHRFDAVTPGKTTRSQLFALGFDPLAQGNAKMLSFIDVRLLFIQPNIPIDYLPDGLVNCLQAKDHCTGYAFDFIKTDSQRVGSFWADIFNFRKRRQVQGWSFRPVFVLVDDVVVHKVANGEPNIRRVEDKRNPLGPLQGAGEYFSDKLK
ncbi:MAG: hypothetical protein GAK45_01946 [Pseudomonas citronellolis]|nr:MAG: hypothetical protein GAK45_01946 [Pseudomonas citronellolis]